MAAIAIVSRVDSVLVTSAFMDVAFTLPLSRAVGKCRSGVGDVCFRIFAASAPQFGSKLSLPLQKSFFLRRENNFARRRAASMATRILTPVGSVVVSCSDNGGASSSLSEKRVLVGCGGASLDFLASVKTFPQPDEKIRTTELQVHGGGNVGNALTAAARLGLDCRIFTKVANDGPGTQILAELRSDGIDVSNVVVAEGVSPFTYVIVDKEKSTRTCIHTPGSPPLQPQELTPIIINKLLNRVDLVYFDGRLAETALLLAEEASKRQLPILVDAERLREGLDDMLAYATYVVASSKFPQSWTSAPTVAEALLKMMLRLPRLKFVIVTLGSSGCIMLERLTPESSDAGIEDGVVDVNSLVESLSREADKLRGLLPTAVSSKACRLSTAGVNNTDQQIWARIVVGTAEAIPPSELVDTTGAGDGFIGGVMYGILAGLSPERLLALGATVGAASCRALGARPGLPYRMDNKVVSLV